MNDFTTRQVVQGNRANTAQNGASIPQAIAQAASRTAVDFDFLIAQAQVESALDPRAKARTSSATGLYQFIESTWLETMKRHGPRFGLSDVAAKISTVAGGGAHVADRTERAAILDMRNDPQIASLMAAGLAEDNRERLLPILGREPDHGELYLAHFLGAGGATRFLSAMSANPWQSAPDLFPRPAAANRPVFYERNGSERSLAGVMDFLRGKMDRALATAPSFDPGQVTRGTEFTPPPYLIADEAVFGPADPPAITYSRYPTVARTGTVSLPPLAADPAQAGRDRPSMSQVLQSTFGLGSTEIGTAQIRRAYDQLKALGL